MVTKKLDFKHFELRHLKLNSKGGLIVDWFDLNQKNDLLSVDSDSIAHEDLTNKLKELKSIFAESLGLLKGWDLARENNNKNEEKLREAIRGWNEEVDRCNVSGFTLTDKGIKISGSLDCDGIKIGLASPLVKFENEDSDLGLKAKEILEVLTKEVWSFIYAGKRDTDLFNQKEEKKSGLNNTEDKHLKAV